MRAVTKALLALISLAAASACRPSPAEQNIAIDNSAAPTDIEALPPDESVEAPTDELANGEDEAANADQPSNAY